MSNSQTIGLVVLLGAVVVGRVIGERALQNLSAEQKTRYLDAFSALRKYSLLPLIAFVLFVFAFPGRLPSWAFVSGLLVYIVGYSILAIRKMRSIGLPRTYIQTYWIGQLTQIGGLLFYFAVFEGWVL